MKLTIQSLSTENLRVPNLNIAFKEGINFLQIPNGTGKTTLLELIRYTLSNDWGNLSSKEIKAFKDKKTNEEYGTFAIKFLFDKSKIDFEVNFDFNAGEVTVDTFDEDGKHRNKFKPPKNLKPFLTKDHIEIFNFSAQIASHHFTPKYSVVKDAVGTFSGRHKLDELKERLKKASKAKHQGSMSGRSATLKNKLDALEKQISKIKTKKVEINSKLKPLEKIHGELKAKIESFEAKNQTYKNKKEILDAKVEELRAKSAPKDAELSKNLLHPINLSKDFLNKIKKISENLEKKKLPGIDNVFFDEVAEGKNCICGSPMTKDLKEAILSSKTEYLGTHDVSFINALKSDLKTRLEFASISDIETDLDELININEERKDAEDDVIDLEATITGEALTKAEVEEFDKIGDKISGFKTELSALAKSDYEAKNDKEKTSDLIAYNPKQIEKNINNLPDAEWLQKQILKKHAATSGYEQANKNREKFEECIDAAILAAEDKIKSALCNDMNKMISSIHTDQDFKVAKIGDCIELKEQERGSGAQEVITVSTFALALLKRSEIDFPMIIDHPVKDVQLEDRSELSKFLSSSTHQCICLVINSEKDGFIRHDETKKLNKFLEKANFITAARSKDAPNLSNTKYDKTSNAIISNDYKFFENFKLNKEGA